MATAPVAAPDPKRPPRRPAIRLAGSERYPVVFYDQQIDNSYLEPVPDPADARRFRLLASACACLFLVIFGMLVLHVRRQHYGYEIARLQAESAQLKVSNQKWELEIARLTDPQTIDQVAHQDLGFEPSTPVQVVRLGSMEPPAQPGGASVMANKLKAAARMQKESAREPWRSGESRLANKESARFHLRSARDRLRIPAMTGE